MASVRTFAEVVAVRALLAIAIVSAATTSSSAARADGASPTAAAKAKAKQAFERGEEQYKNGHFSEAAAAYEESYAAVHDPKALLMLARVQRDDGELLKARTTCEKAREAAESTELPSQATRAMLDEIENELRAIDDVLGFVTIVLSHAPTGTRVTLDDTDVTTEMGQPIRAEPGPLVVTAIAPSGTERTENAMVKAGQTSTVTLSFPWSAQPHPALAVAPRDEGRPTPPREKKNERSPAEPSDTQRTLTWVAGGVGVAGVATFVVFGMMSGSKYEELDGACPEGHCDPGLESDRNSGKTFQTVANVGLVVGAVGLGTAITLFAIGSAPGAAHGKRATTGKLELGLGRVAFSGSFQ